MIIYVSCMYLVQKKLGTKYIDTIIHMNYTYVRVPAIFHRIVQISCSNKRFLSKVSNKNVKNLN